LVGTRRLEKTEKSNATRTTVVKITITKKSLKSTTYNRLPHNEMVERTNLQSVYRITDYSLLTCRHLAGVLVSITAGSVFEAGVRVSNALDVLVGVSGTPPAVRRRVAVQPVRGAERCRRLFV